MPVRCVPVAGCVTLTSSEGGWVPGVPETAPAEKTPPPHLGRQDCVVVWLPTPPPVTWAYGQWLPLFVCPPPGGGIGICLLVWCYLPLIGGGKSATIAYGP